MKKNIVLKTQQSKVDKVLLILPIVLTIVGLVMMTNASVAQAQNLFGDKFFFAKQQLMWAALGLVGFFIAARIPFSLWEKIATPLFWLTVVALALVLVPAVGTMALGARRWITLGQFSLQPAEIAKLTSILYFSRLFTKQQVLGWTHVFTFLFAVTLAGGLIVVEPDLGTSVVIGVTSFVLFFVSGVPLTLFIALIPLLVGVTLLLSLSSSYRKQRLLSFLSGVFDPFQASYHVKQVLLAVASGGLFGVGLGESRQKFLFLPEAATDSIFAVIAEETGFVGSLFVIFLFVVLVARIFVVAQGVGVDFAKLVAVGIGTWIGVQALVNIAAMTATLPLTGIPLPFFSYGGSSLFVTLFALGIVVNISKMRMLKR